MRYDSFESLSLSIPLPQWVSKNARRTQILKAIIASLLHAPLQYVCLDLISVCPQGRPISLDQCLQHFISSETIKEVECENCTKVHSLQYLCLAKFWSFVLLICNSLKTNHRQKTLLTKIVSRHIIIFIWWYFIPERHMGYFFLLSFIKGPQ